MLNQNDKYNKGYLGQADKDSSLLLSKKLVVEVKELFEPYLLSCELYEPERNLRIGNAPAVEINGKLVVAPDIKCITKTGQVFWIEVKDKPQRFYYSDTGADLHQVLGWYDINKFLKQPVLVIFKDPDLNACVPQNASCEKIEQFEKRWGLFKGAIYGGWLMDLLYYDNKAKYPCIFAERSRNIIMNILYFDISRMIKINNIQEIVLNINNIILQDLKVFKMEYLNYGRKGKRQINEDEIRRLSYSSR